MKGKPCFVAAVLAILASLSVWSNDIKVDFQLNWKIVGDHAPYFVAQKKGWFKEAGLDVNIILGEGSGYTVQVVDIGKAHIGIADTTVVVMTKAKGANIKTVGMIFAKHNNCMFFWKDSGIVKPQDLVGKTIAAPAADGAKVMWPAFAKLIGIDPNSVRFINIDPTAKPMTLASRRADVVFEAYQAKPFMEKVVPPDKLGYMIWADYGFNTYAHCYVTSDKVIKENPELLRRFLKVAYKAWDFTLRNPEEAIAILAEYHPINKDDYLANLKMVMEFLKVEDYRKYGLGYIDPEKMKFTMNLVNDYMGVKINFKPEDAYTSAFLPDPPYKYDF